MIQYQKNPLGINQVRQSPTTNKIVYPIVGNLKTEPAGFAQKFGQALKAWAGSIKK